MTQAPAKLALVAIAALVGADAGAAPIAATDASEMRGALAEPSRRSVNEEALRDDGRTLTMVLRAARNPERWTRTRYGPGGSCFSVYWPA